MRFLVRRSKRKKKREGGKRPLFKLSMQPPWQATIAGERRCGCRASIHII